MMRADIVGITMCPERLEDLVQMVVQAVNISLCIVATADAGLIRDYNDVIARLVEQGYTLARTREEFEIFYPVQVVLFNIDGAVPIEKDGWYLGTHKATHLVEF
jgi:hypothetical protein